MVRPHFLRPGFSNMSDSNESLFRTVIASSIDAMIAIDRNGIITLFNPAAEKLFGLPEKEMMGQPLDRILPPEMTLTHREYISGLFNDGSPNAAIGKTLELESIRGNGQRIGIELSLSVGCEANDRYVIAIIRNITDRKRVEQALRESEARYRGLFENLCDLYYQTDNDGNLLVVSPSVEKMAGYKPEELVGKVSAGDLYFDPGERTKFLEKIREGSVNGFEVRLKKKDGSVRWASINAHILQDQEGRRIGIEGILHDVTERKSSEIQNKARLKLLSNLRATMDIENCLALGCQEIYEAELFRRAVFTLHNAERIITHLGQIGLDNKAIKALRNAPPPVETGFIERERSVPDSGNFGNTAQNAAGNIEPDNKHITHKQFSDAHNPTYLSSGKLSIPVRANGNTIEGWLSVDSPFGDTPPTDEVIIVLEEIVDIVAQRIHEIQSLESLKKERQALHDKNVALKEVLANIDEDKLEIKRLAAESIDKIFMPALLKLVRENGTVNMTYYNLLKKNLEDLASSAGGTLHLYSRLTPREIEVTTFIRNGNTSKEIAKTLNISLATVHKHRDTIRRKLGVRNKKINLSSQLKKYR